MHTYLIVGKGQKVEEEALKISEEKSSKLISFELKKIEDVRNLNNLTRLRLTSNTTYFIKNINEASEEALNAFLKNLEEPQEGLSYVLTTTNESLVLPTIVSRSRVTKINEGSLEADESKMIEFGDLAEGKKLEFVDKIKEREAAIGFVTEYIEFNQRNLLSEENLIKKSKNLKTALTTLKHLQANGNVALQLANFVVSLV